MAASVHDSQSRCPLRAHVPFTVEILDLEEPRAGETLVNVAAVGVYPSDWHLMTGATKHLLPVVPGHEGAGLVATIGPGVTRVKPGDHLGLNWGPNCGKCFYCLNDRLSLCAAYVGRLWTGVMLDGRTRLSKNDQPVYHFSALACLAEYCVVPQEAACPSTRRCRCSWRR